MQNYLKETVMIQVKTFLHSFYRLDSFELIYGELEHCILHFLSIEYMQMQNLNNLKIKK